MSLGLLTRSDEDLSLPVACDDPKTLASELNALQPFTVEVVAVWQAFAGKLPAVQQALWPHLAGNGWFRATVRDAKQVIDDICKREGVTNPAIPCETIAPTSPKPIRPDPDFAVDSVANAGEAKPGLGIDPSWHALLKECPRANADKATVIRKGLKQTLGPLEAAALLSKYKECALGVATGGCQRYIVNDEGVTMKLAHESLAAT